MNNRKPGEEMVKRFELAVRRHEKIKSCPLCSNKHISEASREVAYARKDLIEVCDFSIDTEV